MSKRVAFEIQEFCDRPESPRTAANNARVEFSTELVLTLRMVTYDKASGAQLSAHRLPPMPQVRGLSADVLRAFAQPRQVKRLARRAQARTLAQKGFPRCR